MLLINTAEDQRIVIYEDFYITLDRLIYLNGSSLITLSIDDAVSEVWTADVRVGHSLQVAPHVALTFVNVLRGRVNKAILGFDAPRSIPIRGEWIRQS